VNRRDVVIFLALMGMFVTYTQAFTMSTFETNTEFSSLNRYTGPEDFLTSAAYYISSIIVQEKGS